MSLPLYFHPLSSFCWKALIALYEADIPFEPKLVDLSDPAQRTAFQAVWPPAKFPVLRDESRGRTAPESTIIIDYLAQNYRKTVCPLSRGGSPYTASSRVARRGRADPHRRRTSRGAV
ncbi:MAG: glutathione S-transferase N-terminal domain-containing protein [Caulobacteraceae bacterium]